MDYTGGHPGSGGFGVDPNCIFSSLKHMQQLLLVTFFHLTNFWGDYPGPLQVPLGTWGSGDDPEGIFVITE